jgi:hypothetical protein
MTIPQESRNAWRNSARSGRRAQEAQQARMVEEAAVQIGDRLKKK